MTGIRISALAAAASFFLASCSHQPIDRSPSSKSETKTTLDGIRVNPVTYSGAPDWKVSLHKGEDSKWGVVKDLDTQEYWLGRADHRAAFSARINQLLALYGKKGTHTHLGELPKAAENALEEIQDLLKFLEGEKDHKSTDAKDAYVHIAELTEAFNFNFQYPIDSEIWIGIAPFKALKNLGNYIVDRASRPAQNVVASSRKDLDEVHPPDSSFWKNPGPIPQREARIGFGREKPFAFEGQCSYLDPKSGYGIHGGFSIDCGGRKWKIKFGNETHSEPFNSRMVWLLGFNAVPVDYAKGLKVKYDRRVFSEYNTRKELTMKVVSALGFTYRKIELQRELDPFVEAVAEAVLKDGTRVPASRLKTLLVANPAPEKLKIASNYKTSFEKKIDYLVLQEGNVETDLEELKNLGPWDWNGLDHAKRREFRAFGILAAWLNMFDIRLDNNRLRRFKDKDGRKHLQHYVSDLGSGLGRARNFIRYENSDLRGFPNTFIDRQYDEDGRWRKDIPYIISNYTPIQSNDAFDRADNNDIRWMARLIGAITLQQMEDALSASGFNEQEVQAFLQKLSRRRDNLIKVVGLEHEIPLFNR